tara:strand:+ start:686 stop:1444 length:759 start_codon:yes stop_codon:yes gene_type:complete
MIKFPFVFERNFGRTLLPEIKNMFNAAEPFPHVVVDNFLPLEFANFLLNNFPSKDHPVWLDWKKRSPNQYKKLGFGDSSNFYKISNELQIALNEFNRATILSLLEDITNIKGLLPDPYFIGGGMHQILKGGLLDIHTDFNEHKRLKIFRRLNLLIYLNQSWIPNHRGELEFWSNSIKNKGKCVKKISPLFNRAVLFKTDKNSYHGHPSIWNAPSEVTRKSIALYYYTSYPENNAVYDAKTDWQNISKRSLPS